MEGCSSTDGETFNHYKPFPADHHKRYHVFLSAGVDIRKSLVDHLVESLYTAGLDVFIGNEESEKGKNIEVSLGDAVRNSRVYIPLFSTDYAKSARCLDELSLIWTYKSTGTTIIPLFFNVEPSEVRYPDKKGPYAEAFQKHSEGGRSEKEMDAWKEALHQVSLLSGWTLATTAGGHEGKLVKQIVMDLVKTLKINSLYVAKHPEGLPSRIEEVTRLLKMNDHSSHVLGVGIWGMGGLGKTTLAKAVYNNINSKFEASCFVSDVQASAKECVKGLLKLQKQILRDLVKVDESNLKKLQSVHSGRAEMEDRLRSIKALVILDDVDDEEQVDALIGDGVNGYWFGAGSRIIITTRDSQVLTRHSHVIQYPMRGLDPKEGLRLFSWHAFMRTGPPKGYTDITEKIVDACQGLPLSLEVVGACLYGEERFEIWKEALKNLVKNHKKVYNSLKISYDALSHEEKRMFLDIAWFFRGPVYLPSGIYNMDFYVKFWEYLKCSSPLTCIRNLERKSLIRIDDGSVYSIFWMHDHLRDMGRQIVEEGSPNRANRSRLWWHEDLASVTAQTQGMPNVEGLLNFSHHQTEWSTYSWAFPSGRNLDFCVPNKFLRFLRDIVPTTRFDVFIHHRGCDVQGGEANLLYHHLQQKGRKVILDKYSIQAGDRIPESIEHAISTSSVHVAMFSPTYAQSPWCLHELSLMFESRAPIIPLFCGVSASEVGMRNENGRYAIAFREHKESAKVNPEALQKWQKSLRQAAEIKGFEFAGNKGELLEEIEKAVSSFIENENVWVRCRYESLPITTDKGQRKNPEPGDITALPNPKHLHVSEVNEDGTSVAQEYMDQDGQGEASFPPPARNTCG